MTYEMKFGFLRTLFVLLLLSGQAFASEIVLQYSLTEVREPRIPEIESKKKEKEIRLSSKKTVILGKDFFSVTEGQSERIYDFKQRKIHYLDHRTKTRVEISLFSDPAFRIHEFEQRLNIDEVVEKSGAKPLEDLFSLESIFGLQNKNQKLNLTEKKLKNKQTQFLKDDLVVAEITFSDEEVNPEGLTFDKFLIYDHSIHPWIRERIIKARNIPKVIRTRLQSPLGIDRYVLILDRLNTRPEQGFLIPQYIVSSKRPGAVPSSEGLLPLIQAAEEGKSGVPRYEKEWFLEKMRLAQTRKNYLDAALIILEYGLQSGDEKATSEAMQEVVKYQAQDPELDRFLRSLGIAGPEQAKRAIKELQKINRKKASRPHMIDIVISNQESVLGQNEAAEKRMLAALKANPYIAGAYKDLGDMFYTEFDMASAWLCWDFARKQVPEHFMFKPISEYEEELLKEFPYFF